MKLATVCILGALLAGCSAVEDLRGEGSLGRDGPHIYGGVRTFFNGQGVTGDFYRSFSLGNLSTSGDGWGALGILALYLAPGVLDFSLSFVIDTILLPVAIKNEG